MIKLIKLSNEGGRNLSKVLTIVEVSQKQAYIFASKKLRENADRSGDISYVTSGAFFARTAGELYREEENLVYSGGGHTVLQFEDGERAVAFARRVTEAVLRQYPGLELFVKTIPYDPTLTPGDNLKELSKALERKKARRAASFRVLDFGVEGPGGEAAPDRSQQPAQEGRLSEEYRFPGQFEELAKALPSEKPDNFIAVVHIDGNAMGKRVDGVYGRNGGDWEQCRAGLQRFSQGIQADFEGAFRETVEEVIRVLAPEGDLPIRPVILAGDDVCFVTAGSIGLECARVFLEKLSARRNQEDGQPYAACAGVAMVHVKYPFHRAYELSEELCSSAKRFGAGLDQEGRVSAMDWHIEFGQLKDNLSELREDYETEDGCRLELRPMAVILPESVGDGCAPQRRYPYFCKLCAAMRGEYGRIARSKIKELRTALKQGEVEGAFFLQDKEIGDLLYRPLEAAYSLKERMETAMDKAAFRAFEEDGKTVKRCLFFDAIELIDHYQPFEEVEL